jgi:acetylornithine deacetylase/succinyl-diaminopimelate desuccinylase-like protein
MHSEVVRASDVESCRAGTGSWKTVEDTGAGLSSHWDISATALNAAECALAYAQVRHARFVSDLKEFIRSPSISAQPEHAEDLKRCAAWLAEHLRRIGMERVTVVPTGGHPIVYAESCHAPRRPTVLIYGHYDVQPADPLDEWRSPPFEPIVRGNDLYGRGASDDKGQLFAHVKALEAFLQTSGELPVNIKCLFEGEEEIGSPSLPAFLNRYKDKLTADLAVLSDMPIPASNCPAITESMRGALSLELEVRGAGRDLHSGLYGGAIHNPIQVLSEIIARLYDKTGRVAIPGFYDRVAAFSPQDRAYMKTNGPSDADILRHAGAVSGFGEPGYTLYERTTIRPTLTINGITGGYQGSGPKAVIPDHARAKLNFRLIPDQDPELIEFQFRRYIEHCTPTTVQSFVRKQFSAKPAMINRTHPAIRAACVAYQLGFGNTPVFQRSGGTLPVVAMLRDSLGIDTIMMGFALPDDAIHAPNENFHLPNFYKGISTSIHFMAEMRKQPVIAEYPIRSFEAAGTF